jgi:hypothetical protein
MTPKSWGLLLTIMALVSSSAFGQEPRKGERYRVAKVGEGERLESR